MSGFTIQSTSMGRRRDQASCASASAGKLDPRAVRGKGRGKLL